MKGPLKKVVEAVKQACAWFFAYFGSKDGNFLNIVIQQVLSLLGRVKSVETGYERSVRRTLDPKEIAQCVALNAMTAFVHNHDASYIDPFQISSLSIEDKLKPQTRQQLEQMGFEFKNGSILHIESAIKLVLLRSHKGHFYLGFGDAGAVKRFGHDNDLGPSCLNANKRARQAVVQQLTLGNEALLGSCSKAVSLILNDLDLDPSHVTLLGQCYGGMLSAYCALDLGFKAVTINSVSLGAQAQVKLGTKLTQAKDLVTNVFVEGDWTQTLPAVEGIDWIFSRLGFRTPGCFGKKFEIPNCHHHNLIQRHFYSFDTLLGNLGYPARMPLKDLSETAKTEIIESGFDDFTQIQ